MILVRRPAALVQPGAARDRARARGPHRRGYRRIAAGVAGFGRSDASQPPPRATMSCTAGISLHEFRADRPRPPGTRRGRDRRPRRRPPRRPVRAAAGDRRSARRASCSGRRCSGRVAPGMESVPVSRVGPSGARRRRATRRRALHVRSSASSSTRRRCGGALRRSCSRRRSASPLPFLLGCGIRLRALSGAMPRPACRFIAFALFMGVAMSITAFPVLARILTDRGLTRTRTGHRGADLRGDQRRDGLVPAGGGRRSRARDHGGRAGVGPDGRRLHRVHVRRSAVRLRRGSPGASMVLKTQRQRESPGPSP